MNVATVLEEIDAIAGHLERGRSEEAATQLSRLRLRLASLTGTRLALVEFTDREIADLERSIASDTALQTPEVRRWIHRLKESGGDAAEV